MGNKWEVKAMCGHELITLRIRARSKEEAAEKAMAFRGISEIISVTPHVPFRSGLSNPDFFQKCRIP